MTFQSKLTILPLMVGRDVDTRVWVSERSERDTIRGVQIQAGVVCVYIYICVWRYVYHKAELGHSYFIHVSHFKHSGSWKWSLKCFKMEPCTLACV